MSLIIFLFYLFFSFITFKLVRNTKVAEMGICFGALLGLVFFLAIPLFFIIYNGELVEPSLMIAPYIPTEDIDTTFNIFLGWLVIILASSYERRVYAKHVDIPLSLHSVNPKIFFYWMVFLYFAITLIAASKTGAFEEGLHWHDTERNDSAAFIIFKNFSNCYRVVVFGALFYLVNSRIFNKYYALIFAISFSVFDMLISFNRITLLYFLLLFLLLNRKYAFSIFSILCLVTPPIIYVSGVWTWFRGMASMGGIGLDSFMRAWKDARSIYEAAGDSFVIQMNNIFESSNILVFHALVQRVGDSIPIFGGSTYIVRPLTTFIPSTIWEDKPRVFGTYLGTLINDYEGLALNSTLFGEAYANFLYFWPAVLLLTLMLLSKLYLFFSRFIPSVKLMSIFIGVSIWRFDMNFTVACIYSLVLAFILVKIFSGKRIIWK
jgi:hypothetical protein